MLQRPHFLIEISLNNIPVIESNTHIYCIPVQARPTLKEQSHNTFIGPTYKNLSKNK